MNDAIQNIEDQIPSLQLYAAAVSRNEAAADELVQECLLRALTKARSCRPGTGLHAWMFTILHNLHVNGVRRNRDRSHMTQPETTPTGISVAALQPSAVMQRAMNRAMISQPDPRHLVLCCIIEGRQTAAGVSAGTRRPSGATTFRHLRRVRFPGDTTEVSWNRLLPSGQSV